MSERERISRLVLESIAGFGGDTVKDIVAWHLKNTYRVDPSDAVCNPGAFLKALNGIYGQFAYVVEERICEAIASEYGVAYAGGGLLKLSSALNVDCS